MWRIWGRFSGFGGVDATSGTRSRISGHISARARACMIRDRSAFFRTLFGLRFADFGLLRTFFGLRAHFRTHLGLVRGFRNAFGAALHLSDPTNSLHFFGTNFSLTRSTNRLILSRLLLSSLCPSLHRSPAPCRIDRLNQPHAIRIRRHAPCSLIMNHDRVVS